MNDREEPSDASLDRLPTVQRAQALAAAGKIPPVWIGVALVLFFPVGLYGVWKHPAWTAARKGLWTGAWAVPFLLALWFLTPWVIFLTLLGAFGIALYLIWQSKTLDLKTKKGATGAAVGVLLVCVVVEIVAFSIRGYNADQEEQRRRYAEQAERDKGTTGQHPDSRPKKNSNPDFDLSRLKFPASVDVSQGPSGEEIKVEEEKFTVGFPTKEKWYYYLNQKNEKVKHGLFRAYVDAVVITEAVYLNGKLRLKNTWSNKGEPNTVQEYLDETWNREVQHGGSTPNDIARFVVRFVELKVTKYEGGGSSTEEVWERIPDGETTKFYPDGKTKEVIVYDRGKVKSHMLFDTRGKVVFQK